ncbi:hypothetical protein OV203_33495 [Nannocystis sp. ILAH1]|uniref:hypothetical protein n=1 Tax=Nannocystis sp. ILAH1 TaxID=2996789 RepID=UPI00226DE401|nr:hypothetical protein [Nannocystis sp. ILAH1]MCY0992102.1 hypothetical protein [Nannocystis sp. ILAH1]
MSPSRAAVATILAALLALPPPASAAPAEPDPAAVDAGFRSGQDEFNRGEFRAAARTWARAADLLPETAEHRDNRAGIYEYIIDAYDRALTQEPSEQLIEEALGALDGYAETHAAAYPDRELPAHVAEARRSLRARLEGLRPAPAATDIERPGPASAPPVTVEAPKPWKGLVIGGGVGLGASVAMLAVFGVGAARARAHEDDFDSPSRVCDAEALVGECATIHARGESANAMATTGLVAASVLLGAGVALLVVGLRRKSAAQRLSPSLSRTSVGATWTIHF